MKRSEEAKTLVLLFAILVLAVVLFFRACSEQPATEAPEPVIHPPVEETPATQIKPMAAIPALEAWKAEPAEPLEMEPIEPAPEEPDADDVPAEAEIGPKELEMLASVIYQEAGGGHISDETRYMVGDVVLNRIADTDFPDTMEEVLTQCRQYREFYWTGVKWPALAAYEPEAVQRAYDTARDLLSGERHSELYGQGYVWQAEFPQGTDLIYLDGLYFGR